MSDRWTPDDISVLIDHKMEQRANVYLMLRSDGTWTIDPVFTQAGACDGLDPHELEGGCSCDDTSSTEHKRAVEIAQQAEMPSPTALLSLIIDALFPYDTPPDLTDRATIEAWLNDPNRQGPQLT